MRVIPLPSRVFTSNSCHLRSSLCRCIVPLADLLFPRTVVLHCRCKNVGQRLGRTTPVTYLSLFAINWMQLFCLQLEAYCLQWSFFTYNWQFLASLLTSCSFSFFAYSFSFLTYSWSFFAYSGKMRLIRALRDCKQKLNCKQKESNCK